MKPINERNVNLPNTYAEYTEMCDALEQNERVSEEQFERVKIDVDGKPEAIGLAMTETEEELLVCLGNGVHLRKIAMEFAKLNENQ